MISIKDFAAQVPQLFNLKPDVSAFDLKAAVSAEEAEDQQKQQAMDVAKTRMINLMRQGNYDLVLRIIKSLYHDATMDSVQAFAKDPESFHASVETLVKEQSRDVAKFNTVYRKYKTEFEAHFKATMNEWEQWQLALFTHQIEIVSTFLAYKTVEGAVTENDVINTLIHNLDPINPDVTAGTVYMKGKRTEDIVTTGFIGILAVIGAVFAAKKAKAKWNN